MVGSTGLGVVRGRYGTTQGGSAGGTVPGWCVVVVTGTVPGGQCGFSTPTQWVVRWFRTKAERYRYLEHSFPLSQPFSGTIVCTKDPTIPSYFQTCKKGV